jgi:hypothetical protein
MGEESGKVVQEMSVSIQSKYTVVKKNSIDSQKPRASSLGGGTDLKVTPLEVRMRTRCLFSFIPFAFGPSLLEAEFESAL